MIIMDMLLLCVRACVVMACVVIIPLALMADCLNVFLACLSLYAFGD
jgi:hypothetical protein